MPARALRAHLLVATVLLATTLPGCGGERKSTLVEPPPPRPVPPAPPAPARLRVRVAGSGYDVVLAGVTAALDSGAPRAVPDTGALTFDSVPAGPRSVRLGGVAATCAVSGANPRGLTLAAGQDTTVTFDVVCRTRVARVALARAYESVLVGDTLTLTATAYAADGSILPGRPVTWATTGAAALAVTPAGVVTGSAPGGARVTATIDGVEGAAEVTVFAPSTRAPRGFSYVIESRSAPDAPALSRLLSVPADGSPGRAIGAWATYVSEYRWAPAGAAAGARVLLTYVPSDGRPAGTYLLDVDAEQVRFLGALWSSPRWAPDGARIAYARYDAATGGRSVEVLDLRDGTARVVLSSDGEVTGVAWSPDGRRLAVLRRPVATGTDNPFSLWVVPLRGGEPRTLSLPTRAAHVSWAPDGKRLAYDDGDGISSALPSGVWVVDADGRNARKLDLPCPAAVGPGCWTGFPSWSPDGRLIAAQQFPAYLPSSGRHVTFRGVDDATLSAIPVGGPCCVAAPPRWSADGRAVLLVSPRVAPDYRWGVVRAAPGGTSAEFLTTEASAVPAEWVP